MAAKRPATSANASHTDTIAKSLTRYTSGVQIQNALQIENPDAFRQALNSIRSQLSPKIQEVISPQDERLTIIKEWMGMSPGAQDLFSVWDTAHPRELSTLVPVLSILSAVLTLLSTHFTNHALGYSIMKTLLQPVRFRYMNSYIGGSHNELILVTLKLYNVMSNFAGGQEKSSVMEGFGWEIKSLPKLLNMRRRIRGTTDHADPLLRPDIRTLFILFLFSFVDADSTSLSKTTFLEQHRDIFFCMFKGIIHDHYSLARKILEACWTDILSDNKLKRTLKIGIFTEITIGHLLKLYNRVESDLDVDHVPANLVHHFLLGICTHPGSGICFKDRGWYPRESETEDVASTQGTTKRSGRIYNKILANVLKSLKVNEDSRQQELALKILEACPELVAGYWPAAALTLEPRLSTKWIINISFFRSVLSLPIPTATFCLSDQLYNPTPPPFHAVLENILPSSNIKKYLSKGLQSSSSLVQHCTALTLSNSLIKFQHVMDKFREIALALGEDDDGPWSRRRLEVEMEVQKRVPEFMVVVAFGRTQQASTKLSPVDNQNKQALLAESSQRLLLLYQRCLPFMVSEARFDVGKLLQTFSTEDDAENEHDADAAKRFYRVQRLHILNILEASDQFSWSIKSGSTPQTPFSILLKALVASTFPAIRQSLERLICSILSRSVLFQEDPQEVNLWLKALPEQRPSVSINFSADLIAIDEQDESECVIDFLDECVVMCLKRLSRYMGALKSLASSTMDVYDTTGPDELPSPLLMTVLEHLQSKIKHGSIQAHSIISIVAFISRLMFFLLGKSLPNILRAFGNEVERALLQKFVMENWKETMSGALRRELEIMRRRLTFRTSSELEMVITIDEVQDWLTSLECFSIPKTNAGRKRFALRIIDNLRTLQSPLAADQVERLFSIMASLDPSLLSRFVEILIPGQIDFWKVLDSSTHFCSHLDFELLYLHTRFDQLHEDMQKVLVESIRLHKPTVLGLQQHLCRICHGITAFKGNTNIERAQIALLARISEMARLSLSSPDFKAFREIIFVNSETLQEFYLSSVSVDVLSAVQHLLEACFDPMLSMDRRTLSQITSHWFELLMSDTSHFDQDSAVTARLWIKYFELLQLFDLLDRLKEFGLGNEKDLFTVVLDTLASRMASECTNDVEFVRRLPGILSVRRVWKSPSLDQVIANIVEFSMPMYLEGFFPLQSTRRNLASLISRSVSCWNGYLSSIKAWQNIDITQFLSRDMSESTIRIVVGLLYRQVSSRAAVLRWLSKLNLTANTTSFLPILHALLDISASSGTDALESANDQWTSFVPHLATIIANNDSLPHLRALSGYTLVNILRTSKADTREFLQALATNLKALKIKKPNSELLDLAMWLVRQVGTDANEVVSEVLDAGLRSCIDCITDKADVRHDEFLNGLTSLAGSASLAKPNIVETVLSVVIGHCLSNSAALRLAISSLSSCQLKPEVAIRQLQNILQHQDFYKLCLIQLSGRESLIELISRLFHLYPNDSCQVTHIHPLIKVYRGTLRRCDLQIFSIFQLFENHRKLSVAPFLSSWSAIDYSASKTALEALQSLDPKIVFLTCTHFPHWRRLRDPMTSKVTTKEGQLYDPVFLLLLFNQMMAERIPSSNVAWLELFKTNIISVFLMSLSAKDGQIRELALCQIIAFWQSLEHADFQEKPQVQYILDLLKQLMPDPALSTSEYPHRLPTYTTLLLCHALRTVFYPTSSLYPLFSKFLLQRPSLDISDVPMLYSMLYSSSDDGWKKERAWIIKFLADGMVGSDDWKVLKRRHTWDLLASLFQSTGDTESAGLRGAILDVLANLTCNMQATTSLILKSGLLAWIEMQMLHGVTRTERCVEWLKILENILVIVNPEKIDVATHGDWRKIIYRCLCHLLSDKNQNNLAHAVPVILRLASFTGGTDEVDFSSLLDLAFKGLQQLEVQIQDTSFDGQEVVKIPSKYSLPAPPHRSVTIHQHITVETILEREQQLSLWGTLLCMLMQTCMFLNREHSIWNDLIPRMLLWRSLGGEKDYRDITEWTRREVVVNIQADLRQP